MTNSTSVQRRGQVPDEATRAAFVRHLPLLRGHAESALRRVRCADTRDDLVCEALALAWESFVRLARSGREPGACVAGLAARCVRAVRSGRRVAGRGGSEDVLSPAAQVRHGFTLARLRRSGPPTGCLRLA